MSYYPQGLEDCYIDKKTKTGKTIFQERPSHGQYVQTKTNFPTSVLNFNAPGKRLHTNQKPVDLLSYLVKTYTKEGETVLDNCMGSGSTGIACIDTGRKFIGMEKDEKIFDIAVNRIKERLQI